MTMLASRIVLAAIAGLSANIPAMADEAMPLDPWSVIINHYKFLIERRPEAFALVAPDVELFSGRGSKAQPLPGGRARLVSAYEAATEQGKYTFGEFSCRALTASVMICKIDLLLHDETAKKIELKYRIVGGQIVRVYFMS